MAVLIIAVILGLAYSHTHNLDGAQTFMVCMFAWLVVKSGYYCACALMPRYRRGR